MSIKETFPIASRELFAYHIREFRGNKDTQAMGWFTLMNDSMCRYKDSGRYAEGSWGYTVNDELGRRFIIEEVDVDSEKLNIPDLEKASQDDIKALTNVFDSWLLNAVSDDGNSEFNIQNSARFCDFLVIDEGALRSLVDLSKETPPLALVSREERRARINQYCDSHVWLVDSQTVKRLQGIQKGDNYYGWMGMCTEDIPHAWFERTGKSDSKEKVEGSSLGSAPTYAKGNVNGIFLLGLGMASEIDQCCWRARVATNHLKTMCNRSVDYDCTNCQTAKDAAFDHTICLAPPKREPAPNEAVPADTTTPTDAAGYSHYTPDPPVSATVGTGKTENCGPWPAAAAGKTCSTIAFPSGATITISLEVNPTLGTVISDWTGRFGGKGDAWRAFPFGVWDGCLGGNSKPDTPAVASLIYAA
ncbi:hypothetical protein V492_03839 [Pseudogymnoascus sp. VKM F-4246]|nr:hypothetical protein V492_03839 [Pseudogymnoascus sp. VKM F-4246]